MSYKNSNQLALSILLNAVRSFLFLILFFNRVYAQESPLSLGMPRNAPVVTPAKTGKILNNQVTFSAAGIQIDNDFLLITRSKNPDDQNKDRHYTGGGRFVFAANFFPGTRITDPLKWGFAYQTLGCGTNAYTPYNIGLRAIDRNDRPYACFTYISIGNVSADPRFRQRLAYEVVFGEMGSPIAHNLQTILHRSFPSRAREDPQGWYAQIAGGDTSVLNNPAISDSTIADSGSRAVTANFNLSYSKSWKINNLASFSFNPEINFGGLIKSVATGVGLNLGAASNDIYGTFNQPSAQSHFVNMPVAPYKGNINSAFRVGAFGSFRSRFVWHNAYLNGLNGNDGSVYTIGHNSLQNFVWEWNIGFMIVMNSVTIAYNSCWRTREFEFQQQARQRWGNVSIFFTNLSYSK